MAANDVVTPTSTTGATTSPTTEVVTTVTNTGQDAVEHTPQSEIEAEPSIQEQIEHALECLPRFRWVEPSQGHILKSAQAFPGFVEDLKRVSREFRYISRSETVLRKEVVDAIYEYATTAYRVYSQCLQDWISDHEVTERSPPHPSWRRVEELVSSRPDIQHLDCYRECALLDPGTRGSLSTLSMTSVQVQQKLAQSQEREDRIAHEKLQLEQKLQMSEIAEAQAKSKSLTKSSTSRYTSRGITTVTVDSPTSLASPSRVFKRATRLCCHAPSRRFEVTFCLARLSLRHFHPLPRVLAFVTISRWILHPFLFLMILLPFLRIFR